MGRLKLLITDRDGSRCLTASVLVLIVTLVLAASAQADEPVPGGTPAPAGTQESAGSQNPAETPAETPTEAPQAEGQPQGGEGAPEGQGAASGAPSEASGGPSEESAVATGPEEQPVLPAPEEQAASTTPEESAAPIVPEPAPEPAPVEPAPVEVQSVTPSAPAEEGPVVAAPEEHVVAAEVTKETRQGSSTEGLEESTSKAVASERGESAGETGLSPAHSSALPDTPVAQLAATRADPAGTEAPLASDGVLPVIATIASTEVEGPPPGGGPTARAGMTSAQRAGSFSCELSELGGHLTDNCTVGWLGVPRFLSTTPSGLVTAASSLVAATIAGSPAQGGHGGSAVSSPPVGPAPSPTPGGAAGAATGASGVAPLSTFLTLAGLLLLGAPRVLRRLRLSCEPWLAGCFVLIPERPD
jgi:hypothetical protein